jgi:hypothetical protein
LSTKFFSSQLERYESSGEELTGVYGMIGLASPLDETLLFDPPCAIKTVLIPFEGQITYDSLLLSYPHDIWAQCHRTTKSHLSKREEERRNN